MEIRRFYCKSEVPSAWQSLTALTMASTHPRQSSFWKDSYSVWTFKGKVWKLPFGLECTRPRIAPRKGQIRSSSCNGQVNCERCNWPCLAHLYKCTTSTSLDDKKIDTPSRFYIQSFFIKVAQNKLQSYPVFKIQNHTFFTSFLNFWSG